MDFREIVSDRLEALGWNAYGLVKEVKGKVPSATVYDFLRGTSTINSAALAVILEALGLTISDRKKKP